MKVRRSLPTNPRRMIYWPRTQPHSNEARSLLIPTSPIQGGRANPCLPLDPIFGVRNSGRDGGTYRSCGGASCCLHVQPQRSLCMPRTKIHLPGIRRRRSSANRNSGRIARFAMGWARGAEGGGQTSHAHRSATAARTRKCFTTSTMESRARQCPQQRMEESASACRTEKSGK